jgi:Transglutaminase-like superfamily
MDHVRHIDEGGLIVTYQGKAGRGLVPAPWLRTVKTPVVALIVDYRDGEVTLLADDVMRAWYACVEPHHASASLRPVDPHHEYFAEQGWLVSPGAHLDSAPAPIPLAEPVPSWGTQEAVAELLPPGDFPRHWGLLGFTSVLVVLLARELGPANRQFARLRWLTRLGRSLPLATDDQAMYAVRAVRHAARLLPARVACLEESVAVTMVLAAMGKRSSWRHGVAVDPVRLHAWIADRSGEPVEEPADTAQYTTIN